MSPTSPIQGFPYPDDSAFLKDVPDFIRDLTLGFEQQVVMVFQTINEWGAKVTTFKPGMLAFLKTEQVLMLYTGSQFVQVWPATPSVRSGTAAPTGSGKAGDIFIQY